MNHLAILKGEYIDLIADGIKTIESRLTKTRQAPWQKVLTGDRLFFKESGVSSITVTAIVLGVDYYEIPLIGIERLKEKYNDQVKGSDEYWKSKQDARYASFIWLRTINWLRKPIPYYKRDGRPWVIFGETLPWEEA